MRTRIPPAPGDRRGRLVSWMAGARRLVVLGILVAVVVFPGCAGRGGRLTSHELGALRETVLASEGALVSYTASWRETVLRRTGAGSPSSGPPGPVRVTTVAERWGAHGRDQEKQILISWEAGTGDPSVRQPFTRLHAVWSDAEGVYLVTGFVEGITDVGSPPERRRGHAKVNIRPPDHQPISPPVYDVTYWLSVLGAPVGEILSAGTGQQRSDVRNVRVSRVSRRSPVTREAALFYKLTWARGDIRSEVFLDPAAGYMPTRITHRRSSEPLPSLEVDISLSYLGDDVWFPGRVVQRFFEINTSSYPRGRSSTSCGTCRSTTSSGT